MQTTKTMTTPKTRTAVTAGSEVTHLVTGTAHDGGEDGPGGIVTGKAGLAHARAIVHDQSGNLVVTHVDGVCSGCLATRRKNYTGTVLATGQGELREETERAAI